MARGDGRRRWPRRGRRSQKSEPDLVLCDLMLPDGSGIDLLREVKAPDAVDRRSS